MGFTQLTQWIFMLIMAAGLVALWVRALRPPKDDPRLSKGLQLLQSKIAVLEDLADRTDNQVQQLNLLIEKKAKELQEKILEVDRCLLKIDQNLVKSKEIAKENGYNSLKVISAIGTRKYYARRGFEMTEDGLYQEVLL